MENIIYSNNGVTFAKGFKVSSTSAGFKKGREDMALIVSEVPAECAIVVTSNKVKAAPVIWDKEITEDNSTKKGVIINIGSANACTGEEGYKNAKDTAIATAKELGCDPTDILVSSTGVIGVQLEMDKILSGVKTLTKDLKDDLVSSKKAAAAILTTDTVTKTASAEFKIGESTVKIGAMAKGSGMIRPNMATMLSYACTDCNIKQDVLQEALLEVTEDTYNMISVDGDMSTNDTAVVLANGLADNKCIDSLESEEGKIFLKALFEVEKTLANAIVKDGEGATKMMEVNVRNASSKEDARKIAKAVSESNLVKAALFGRDANWGRIMSSIGSSGAKEVDEKKINLNMQSPAGTIELYTDGSPIVFDEDVALEILSEPEIVIDIDMGLGDQKATAWGCDLTYDYVKINGEYRS